MCVCRHRDKSVKHCYGLTLLTTPAVGLGDQSLPSPDSGSAESHEEHAVAERCQNPSVVCVPVAQTKTKTLSRLDSINTKTKSSMTLN